MYDPYRIDDEDYKCFVSDVKLAECAEDTKTSAESQYVDRGLNRPEKLTGIYYTTTEEGK